MKSTKQTADWRHKQLRKEGCWRAHKHSQFSVTKRALILGVGDSRWTPADCPGRPASCRLWVTAAGPAAHSTGGCGSKSSQNTRPTRSEPPPRACRWPGPGSLPAGGDTTGAEVQYLLFQSNIFTLLFYFLYFIPFLHINPYIHTQ